MDGESPQPRRIERDASSRYGGNDDHWHHGDMLIELETEFYTAAFVSPLHLHQQRKWYERAGGEAFFTIGMLGVACMQCLAVVGMASYLSESDRGYMDEFKLGTGLLVTGGTTLTMAHSKDICGDFMNVGFEKLTGVNTLAMSDGTKFTGTSDLPMFHSYKMPSGFWTTQSTGQDDSYMDKQLRVVHEVNPAEVFSSFWQCHVEYGVLFVVMVCILWYHVLHEWRKIGNFSLVLAHFKSTGFVKETIETTALSDSGQITITALTVNAFAVGCCTVFCRIVVSVMMLIWGTSLLAASWNKLSLVLNSLAIGIVFELDAIIAYAVIDKNTMSRIECIEPVSVPSLRTRFKTGHYFDLIFSILMFFGVVVGAVAMRAYQVQEHAHHLHNAAALCLFAGPPPPGKPDVLAPVPGFCESLLSMTCAPNVSGPGSTHGHCVVTDQKVFRNRTVMLYADSELFDGMHDAQGRRTSMASWGKPASQLVDTNTWQDDKHLHAFRRVCLQLYHPLTSLDERTVNKNPSISMYAAPFYCPRENLFSAVFGDTQRDFDRWSSSLDLASDKIVAALDGCQGTPAASPRSLRQANSSTPPGIKPKPADLARTAPVKILEENPREPPHRALRHARRKHKEVSRLVLKPAASDK